MKKEFEDWEPSTKQFDMDETQKEEVKAKGCIDIKKDSKNFEDPG